jgi:hypothetical protein
VTGQGMGGQSPSLFISRGSSIVRLSHALIAEIALDCGYPASSTVWRCAIYSTGIGASEIIGVDRSARHVRFSPALRAIEATTDLAKWRGCDTRVRCARTQHRSK